MFTSRVTPISALLLAASLVSCAPEIDRDAAPEGVRVTPVFDPATSTIPLPNDVALDENGSLPNEGGTGAEGAFNDYLSRVVGWNPSSLIQIPFSGEVDEESLASDTVRFYRINSTGVLDQADAGLAWMPNDGDVCNPDVCAGVVTVTPEVTIEPGESYAVVVTRGVRAGGERIGEPSAMFYALSREPLTDENGLSRVGVLDNATAETLEGLRQNILPVVAGAEADGILRSNIAVAFQWTVTANTFTVLDGESGVVPLPNTLALDADGTFPRGALGFCGAAENANSCATDDDCATNQLCALGRCVGTSCAQAEFDRYLDGLHGWPTSTPITLPLSGPIDVDTLNANSVQVWRVDEDGPVRLGADLAYDAENSRIVISPDRAMDLNSDYFAFATRELKAPRFDALKDPVPVLPPASLALAVQPDPVANEAGESLVSRLSDAQAIRIEGLRQALRPLVGAVEGASGVGYGDLVAIWNWSTLRDAFVVFDPAATELPFPNALLTTGCPDARPICALFDPQNPPQDPLQASLFSELSKRTGFSTTGTNWLPVSGQALDPESVTAQSVLISEVVATPPPLIDQSDYELTLDFGHILLDMRRPLLPETQIAGLVSNDLLAEDGTPAQPTAPFVFLRSRYPLVDESGQSLVSVLDDATAARLEPARRSFSQLFLAAAVFGYEREDIIGAWAYTTGQTTRPLQQLRAEASEILNTRTRLVAARACEPDCSTDDGQIGPLASDAVIADPDVPMLAVEASAIDRVQWEAEFETVRFLDANRRLVGFSEVTEPTIGLSLFVPKPDGACTAPFDVAIYQHGFGGYRKNALAVANHMAERCIATVAIDLPLHGGRTPGSMTLHPELRPMSSGDGFIGADLVAAKGNILQAAVDLVVLIRLIKAGGLDGLVDGGGPISDASSEVGFVGISMGGFVGTLFAAVEPELGPTVLNVAGGNYSTVLTGSELFADLANNLGPMPGTFSYLQTLHFVDWLGEHADPYVFGRHLVENPLEVLAYDPTSETYTVGSRADAKSVLMQMAQDDPTVPNESTRLLAREVGVSLDETTFMAGHGFLQTVDPASDDFEDGRCAREQAASWLASGFAGQAELPMNLTATNCVMGN